MSRALAILAGLALFMALAPRASASPGPITIRQQDDVEMFMGFTRVFAVEVASELRDRCITLAFVDVSGRSPFRGGRAAIFSERAAFNTIVDSGGYTTLARCVRVPENGRFEFTITSDERDAHVRPLVFADEDGDGRLDLDADGVPTEPFALGGATLFVFPLRGMDDD